uniref:Uncharacterized protein n=1 Tax=Bos indicus x Bos taurus TaxID=30522 RepID=A0A4W2IE07_BOBOX
VFWRNPPEEVTFALNIMKELTSPRTDGQADLSCLKKPRRPLFLPSTGKKSAPANGNSPEGDLPRLVDDMFIFQNTEFTKVVGNRFLVCVDCEIGPIGCHCLDDKNSFYVSLEWVSHD